MPDADAAAAATDPSSLSDPELCALARQGDRGAVAVLCHRHTGLVCRAVRGLRARTGADPDDLKQAGYLALCRAVTRWDPAAGAKVSTYLFVAVENAVKKENHKHVRAGRVQAVDPADGLAEVADHRAETSDPPPDTLPSAAALPPVVRLLCRLVSGADGGPGLGVGVAARRLGLTPHQARGLLNRAGLALAAGGRQEAA